MSVENSKPKPNLKTKEAVLEYLEKNYKISGTKKIGKTIDTLLKTVEDFEPGNPSTALKIYYDIGRLGFKISEKQIESFFKELTGYEIKDIIMSSRTPEKEEGDTEKEDTVEISEKKGNDRSLLDMVADAKITNLTIDMVKFGMKSYPKIKGESTLGNILKGISVGTLALTTIIGGSGAILAARALRLVGKGLKAIKGTVANALHKNALKNMEKTKEGIDAEQQLLAKVSEAQKSELDKFALDNGLEDEKAYKTIQALRDGKILSQDAERTILNEYDEISLSRDEKITRIINADTLERIEQTYGIDQDEMAAIISRTTVDEEGKIEFPENVNLPEFDEDILNAIKVAVRDEGVVMGAQESSKLAVLEYVEYKDGVVVVKEGVDIDTLPKEVSVILTRMQGARVSEDLFQQVMYENNNIAALIMCEEEILTNTAIEANREMSEIYADRGEIVTEEKKGVIRSSVEAITAADLRLRAEKSVANRVKIRIQDSVIKYSEASESLIRLACEKLIERTQEQQRGENTQTLEENQSSVHRKEDGELGG